MNLDFSAANKANKKAFRTMRTKLTNVKSSPTGVTAVVDVVYCPPKPGKTVNGNPVKDVTVRVMEIVKTPPQMARRDPETPGAFLVKRKKVDIDDKGKRTYAWSDDEVGLKPGDELKLSFISVPTDPIPPSLMASNANDLTLQISSLVPSHHINKSGNLSMDVRTGRPRVFWTCSKSIISLTAYQNTPSKVVSDLHQHLPFWKYAFSAQRPTRTQTLENGSVMEKATFAHPVICFGGTTKTQTAEDGTELFVYNDGVVSADEGEYVTGQNSTYKNLGILVSIYALYDERKWDPRTQTMATRRVYQNTIVRFCTRDNLVTKTFLLVDPGQWAALAPHFVRALNGLIFVRDPYQERPNLLDNVQTFAETSALVTGGSREAQAAIDAGNGVQRGTVVTIDRMVLDLPTMIRQIGTPIPVSDAIQMTAHVASAKGNQEYALLTQNQVSRPFKQDVICLSTFVKTVDPKSLRDYTVYLVTPSKNWNAGSDKSPSEVMAEYQANDDPDRDCHDRTFETTHCALYAVHNRTKPSLVYTDSLQPHHRPSVRDTSPPQDLAQKAELASKTARAEKKMAKRQQNPSEEQ